MTSSPKLVLKGKIKDPAVLRPDYNSSSGFNRTYR
jgi:hypothetical protein